MALTLAEALGGLGQQASSYLARQQTTTGRSDTGAFIRADWGIDDPGGTAGLGALSLWVRLVRLRHPALIGPAAPDDGTLARRSLLALGYLERAQRPSGLTDLRDCNYDSSPDAGFILQAILPPLLLSRQMPPGPPAPEWEEVTARLSGFARRMTEGACGGGFHTPNHRWVIAGALHLAEKLFPDILALAPAIASYLAEGPDVDEDGFYLERSAGVYDAICARSLFLLADRSPADGIDLPDFCNAALRNLQTDTFLLNADGTIETGLSRRQDAGAVAPPPAANLAVPYLLGHFLGGDQGETHGFADLARWLWDRTPPEQRDYYGMSQALLAHGEPPATEASPLSPLTASEKHFPHNGLWRLRRGPLSVSVFRDSPRLLNVRYGSAYLAGVSIHQSYFGVGQFLADEMQVTPGETDGNSRVRLISGGRRHPYRPGYEQPLGRPVAPAEWQEAHAHREIRRVPPMASELTVEAVEAGLRLRYRTTDGLDRVTAQVAFDFPAGGVWETEDTSFEPQAGQTVFLKQGCGTMRYPGSGDAIRIGPGADAHRMAKMRDAAPPAAPGLVRILMTFVTPVDHAFSITGGTWPAL
jgi:hypothetical protein